MKHTGRPPTAYGAIDERLADLFAIEWDRRAGMPAGHRLPSTLRAIRRALQDIGALVSMDFRAKAQSVPSDTKVRAALCERWVVEAVAHSEGIPMREMLGPRTDRYATAARDKAAWALRHARGLSFPNVGLCLGGRNHSTIMTAVARSEARLTETERAFLMTFARDTEARAA